MIVSERTMKAEDSVDRFLSLRAQYPAGYAMWHCRIATHGTLTVDNCHPFPIGEGQLTYLAHNGVLSIPMDADDTRSDTRVFAEETLLAMGGVSVLDNPAVYHILEKWAVGSKIAVLTVDPAAKFNLYLLNEKSGSWDNDGVWWSNTHHRYKAPTQKTYYTDSYLDYQYSSKYGKYDYATNKWDPTYYLTHEWDPTSKTYRLIDPDEDEYCVCPPDFKEGEKWGYYDWCWTCGLEIEALVKPPLALVPPMPTPALPFLTDEEYTRLFTDGDEVADKTWDCENCAGTVSYADLVVGQCSNCEHCLDCAQKMEECLCYWPEEKTDYSRDMTDDYQVSDYDYEMFD